MTDEELIEEKKEKRRKYHREYMREYNKTGKGKEYNYAHVKEYRNKHKKPHSNRPQRISEYRQVIVSFLIARDGLVCGFCGETLEDSKIHIDHIIPVALGGLNVMSNLRLAHPTCNLKEAHKIRKITSGY